MNATQTLVSARLFFAIGSAKDAQRAAILNIENGRRQVLFGVARAYYATASLKDPLGVSQRLLEIAQRQEHDAQVRYGAGAIAKVGLIRAQIDRARAEEDVKRARAAYLSAKVAVAALLARDTAFEVEDPPEPTLPPADLDTLVNQGLQSRPDVQAYKYVVASEEENRRAQVSRYLPDVQLFGRYLWANQEGLNGRHDAWYAGVQLQWVLLDGFRRESDIREASGRIAEAKARAEGSVVGPPPRRHPGTARPRVGPRQRPEVEGAARPGGREPAAGGRGLPGRHRHRGGAGGRDRPDPQRRDPGDHRQPQRTAGRAPGAEHRRQLQSPEAVAGPRLRRQRRHPGSARPPHPESGPLGREAARRYRSLVIRYGPAGWDYPDWAGIVYPRPEPAGFDRLAFLARFFGTVEVDSASIAPTRRGGGEWCERVAGADRFRFAAKLWRRFTHEREPYGAAEVELARAALDRLQAGGPAGRGAAAVPLVVPARSAAEDWLRGLFRAFAGLPLVLEVRHASWDAPGGAGRAGRGRRGDRRTWTSPASGTPSARTPTSPPRWPTCACTAGTGGTGFARGPGATRATTTCTRRAELEPWAERVREMAASSWAPDVYVVTNNHFRGQAVANAKMLEAWSRGARWMRRPA